MNLNLQQKQQAYLLNFRKTINVNFEEKKCSFLAKKKKKKKNQQVFISFYLNPAKTRNFTIISNFICLEWRLEKKHLPAKCIIPWTNTPNWKSTSMATESLKIYQMIFNGKSISSRDFVVPLTCFKKISNSCNGPSENCIFTIGF